MSDRPRRERRKLNRQVSIRKRSAEDFSADTRKKNEKRNKWHLNPPPRGAVGSLVEQQEMALAEARRPKAEKMLFRFRAQLLRRIFTVRRRTVLKPSRACSVQC